MEWFSFHMLLVFSLGLFALYMLFQKSFKPKKPQPQLTDKEIEDLIKDWKPQPLHTPLTPLQTLNSIAPCLTTGPTAKVTLETGETVLNLATTNFLGLVEDPQVKKAAENALRKYGCGSCGPRGFYGTLDIHLELEDEIAKFMGTEAAIMYSSSFATFSSAIPAFSKRDDILICDKGINFGLKTGVTLSRSQVEWFDHNNIKQLEAILIKIKEEDIKTKRRLNRRFLVIEGLYQYHGDLAPMDIIMELKKKYCFRIILDDSNGVGVLGKTGRGTMEHFNLHPKEIELFLSSLGNTLASAAGFCCGSQDVVAHQRLNSSGYVFSASSPPFLVAASIAALAQIDKRPQLLTKLNHNISLFRKNLGEIEGVSVLGADISPIIHLRISPVSDSPEDRMVVEYLLQEIVDLGIKNGVGLTRAKYCASETGIPAPSIAITISANLSEDDVSNAATIVRTVVSQVLHK